MILLHLNRKVWWIHYKIIAGEHKDISEFQNALYIASIFTTKRVPQRDKLWNI